MNTLHSRPRRYAAMAAAASALVATAGLTGAGPAQSVPDVNCPAAAPESGLTADQAVTGLTVTSGTTPTGFTGSIIGVIDDGIAPGTDMIMADLHSTEIDRVGIWQGMSGSPVYDADGRLIGAVSYGLSLGPSTVAGITPAADLRGLLDGGAGRTAPRTHVALPATMVSRLARTGVATRAQARQGMSQIKLPLTISGVSSDRLRKAGPVHLGAKVAPGGPTSDVSIPVSAGSNVAASLSYGAITFGALGTTTLTCGSEVVAFGHPMQFSGAASMSLHGARGLYIQADPTLAGFKVANLGAPIGTVDGDHLAGIHGVVGALPPSSTVTSRASVGTSPVTTGTTHITQEDYLPELSFYNALAASDKALDGYGPGMATAGWTIRGLRRSGAPFSFTRSDTYADSYDVTGDTAYTMADDIYAIQDNPGERVTVTSVSSSTHVQSAAYETYVVAKVQARQGGRWVRVSRKQPLAAHAGGVARLKVLLTSRQGADRTVRVRVNVPQRAAGRVGVLQVLGGNSDYQSSEEYDGDESFEDTPAPSSSVFPAFLKALAAGPTNNQVVATLRFRHVPASARKRTGTATLNRVVSGEVDAPVIALP